MNATLRVHAERPLVTQVVTNVEQEYPGDSAGNARGHELRSGSFTLNYLCINGEGQFAFAGLLDDSTRTAQESGSESHEISSPSAHLGALSKRRPASTEMNR